MSKNILRGIAEMVAAEGYNAYKLARCYEDGSAFDRPLPCGSLAEKITRSGIYHLLAYYLRGREHRICVIPDFDFDSSMIAEELGLRRLTKKNWMNMRTTVYLAPTLAAAAQFKFMSNADVEILDGVKIGQAAESELPEIRARVVDHLSFYRRVMEYSPEQMYDYFCKYADDDSMSLYMNGMNSTSNQGWQVFWHAFARSLHDTDKIRSAFERKLQYGNWAIRMNEQEREVFESLPDTVTLFRAEVQVPRRHSRKDWKLSWSLSQSDALLHAHRILSAQRIDSDIANVQVESITVDKAAIAMVLMRDETNTPTFLVPRVLNEHTVVNAAHYCLPVMKSFFYKNPSAMDSEMYALKAWVDELLPQF